MSFADGYFVSQPQVHTSTIFAQRLTKLDTSSSKTRGRRHANTERFVLTIEGLNCACCENGIAKAIDQIPAIHSYQVNLVLARVEIDLDIDQDSVGEVKKKLYSATGYKFEEYAQAEGQVLELLVDDVGEMRRVEQPPGVTLLDVEEKKPWTHRRIFSGRSSVVPSELRPTSPSSQTNSSRTVRNEGEKPASTNPFRKHAVRIRYDAKTIGARDVLNHYQEFAPDQDIQLAPPSEHPSLAIGAKQTKRASIVCLVRYLWSTQCVGNPRKRGL
jgi:copper chaperone CopZ